MKIHDIEIAIKNDAKFLCFKARSTNLLRDERRKKPEGAAKAMHHNSVVLGLIRRLFPASQTVGIFAMDDLDMMPLRDQRACQRPHKNAITAEMVRRIKRGDHAKAHELSRHVRLIGGYQPSHHGLCW